MPSEYRALVAKVTAFTEAASLRRRDELACRPGCASCCQVWLRVSAVEADEVRAALARLPPEERARVRARGRRELEREARAHEAQVDAGEVEACGPAREPAVEEREVPSVAVDPRCAMLDDEGRCAVYEARPLICRTQGHALRYPFGFVPREAIARKRADGDVIWCPLNYRTSDPAANDVLDAERVDQILAVVAERYARARGRTHEPRRALSELAAEHDMLKEDVARHHELAGAQALPSGSECAREYRERDDPSERQDPTCRGATRGR